VVKQRAALAALCRAGLLSVELVAWRDDIPDRGHSGRGAWGMTEALGLSPATWMIPAAAAGKAAVRFGCGCPALGEMRVG